MQAAPLLDLDAFFTPRSIAVLGASSDAAKIGGRPIKFLKTHGYAGRILPVNPKAAEVQGLPAYADVASIPEVPDHAVIALPQEAVLPAVEACAARGVRGVTIFSSGFAEIGDEGRRQQVRLAAIAAAADMRVLGPNCMGHMNFASGVIASFAFMVDLGLPPRGRIALVSQSGAFGGQALVMARDKRVPLGAWVTTGNECDIELADCIAHFARDPGYDVIMGYMEGCKTPERLIAALEIAQAHGKSVIMVKAGGSRIGREAVQSHTGALAGNDRVFDAIFRRYGVHRADSVESFFDVAYAASGGRYPAEGKVGIFTVSGGIGVLATDAAEKQGLAVPALPGAAQDRIRLLLPHASVRNPVDGTAQIWSDMRVFGECLSVMADEGDFDAMLLFFTAMPHSPPLQAPLKEALLRLRAAHPDRLLVLSMLAPEAYCRELADAGFLLFEDTTRAIRAIGALRDLASAHRPSRQSPPEYTGRYPSLGTARSEHELKRVLFESGIPVPRETLARDLDEARAAAAAIGYPVALKISSPDIAHKSDAGGVALGLGDEAALRDAWTRMMADVRAAHPQARLEGALVSFMAPAGIDMIIGAQQDPVFGPVVLVGFGGIYAELLDDTALRLAPVGHAEAHGMLRELRGHALLEGMRGQPPADIDALAEAIVRLSGLAAANRACFDSLEVNPLRVFREGALALDAALNAPSRID